MTAAQWHDKRVQDATSLDRLRIDLGVRAEEMGHDHGNGHPAVVALRQLESQTARLSYDLKAFLRLHKPERRPDGITRIAGPDDIPERG